MRIQKITLMVIALVSLGRNCAGQEVSGDLMLTPPLPPFLAQFEVWAQQFVQWPQAPFPVSSIEVSVSSDSKALYDIVLEDRVTHLRSHYLSDPSLVSKIHEGISYLTSITVKKTGDAPVAYEFSFTDHEGNPVFWRFVQGSEVSGRGAGLTEISQWDPHPQVMLMYREQGASAGQGTALRIGKENSVAEVWKEVSVPPYFTAYKGALTIGADDAFFIPGEVEWNVDRRPRSLTVGESWKLSSDENWKGVKETRTGSVTISKVSADGYTLLFQSESFGSSRINADIIDGKWRIKSVTYGDSDHGLTVAFEPGVVTSTTAAEQHPTFEIRMAKNQLVAKGAAFVRGGVDGQLEMEWQFQSPNWARAQRLTQKFAAAPGRFFIRQIVATRKQIAGSSADPEIRSAQAQ